MAKKAKPAKRGRPVGSTGPYKMSLSQMMAQIKELRAKVAKLEKVLN